MTQPTSEKHFTASNIVRDIIIGMSDGLTVPFALAAGLSGAVSHTTIILIRGGSGSPPPRATTIFLLPVPGNRHQQGLRELRLPPQLFRHLVARDPRQANIQEENVGQMLLGHLQARLAGVRDKDLVMPARGDFREQFGCGHIVVDDEHAMPLSVAWQA